MPDLPLMEMNRSNRISEGVFSEMARKWPSVLVARTEIEKFTGGMIRPKYMANLDSLGLGPARIFIGRRVGYPIKDLIDWLRQR